MTCLMYLCMYKGIKQDDIHVTNVPIRWHMDICQARDSIFLATAAAPPLPFSRGEPTASPEDERVVGRGKRQRERERESPPPPHLFRDFRETLIHRRSPGSPRRTHSRSMGSVMSSGGSPSKGDATLSPVVLNVYDLTPLNNYVRWLGIGIFHSGIEGECPYLLFP